MEIRNEIRSVRVTNVLFDFDGTLSTLRSGWETVMAPMMHEYLSACPLAPDSDALRKEIDAFIDESTGIQTIFQMKWLRERVEALGGKPLDAWNYKAEYNRRLMLGVEIKKQNLLSGKVSAEAYLMKGAKDFLLSLREKNVKIYVASGTDHPAIVTLGREGCIVSENGKAVLVPARKVTGETDIVGAGDTFLSAVSLAYAAGAPLPEAALFANTASAVTVKKLRTTGTASKEEIDRIYSA